MSPSRSHSSNPSLALLGAFSLALGIALISSCVSIAAWAGRQGLVDYRDSERVCDFVAEFPEAWDAALEALDRLEYGPVEEREVDGVRGHIVGESYEVQLERHLEGITRIRVRIGRLQTQAHYRMGNTLLQEIAVILDTDVQIQEWTEQVEALSAETREEAARR